MSGHTSPPHIVVAGTRRSWTREEKRAIVDEAESTSTTVSAVARRHGLTPSLLFRWRREVWDEEHAASLPVQPAFVALALPAPPRGAVRPLCRSSLPSLRSRCRHHPAAPCDTVLQNAAIEIELAGGHRVRAQAGADQTPLRDVIAVLLGR